MQGGEQFAERSVATDPDLAASVRRLELAVELRELEAKIGPLRRRHGRIIELAAQVNQIENQISNLRVPDKAVWRAIQARAQERNEQAHDRWQQATKAALSKAEDAWKADEAVRLAAVEARY